MVSISSVYFVEVSTVSNIIAETCLALLQCLHNDVIPLSKTQENCLANDFLEIWNVNHCIGAIDEKCTCYYQSKHNDIKAMLEYNFLPTK